MKQSNKFLYLFIISILISSSNSFGQNDHWEKNVTYNNIKFKKVRFLIENSDTLQISGILKNNTVIDGIPCKKNIVFNRNWQIRTFILADDYQMMGSLFPEGTRVSYGSKSIVILFGKDTEFQNYCCNGNFNRWYSTGIFTVLYPSGKLKAFYSCKNVTIDGIYCKSSPFSSVRLHENGKLKECNLAKKQIINGKSFKKNTELIFDEKGNIESAVTSFFWWFI
ncbi:MAG: hypothetical protein HN691_05480 [Bacteroidetes bacterium]|jgi:hypothetical protein|nr:hypothetical protein [Bacteroidota bacterium]